MTAHPFYTDDAVTIWHGNALALPLPDASVDLVVTSPPYFALRSYTDNGRHYEGQIGSEPTPGEYVDALIAATREMVRVLKPSGSIWVNLGDKYAGGGGQWDKDDRPDPNGLRSSRSSGEVRGTSSGGKTYGLRPKSLLGIPWRYALACIDRLGLILRAEIIWSKPNGLPESVTDRVRRSHEQWFHFVKQPRYYAAVDEIREETQGRPGLTWGERKTRDDTRARYSDQNGHGGSGGMADNPLGKLPGSVWTIPTQPLTVPPHLGVDHFAAFPLEWPRRIIRGWTPSGICVACGEGRRPIVDAEYIDAGGRSDSEKFARIEQGHGDVAQGSFKPQEMRFGRANRSTTITGYACACPDTTAPTTPAVVLDPFAGTGTTGLAAKALGRRAHLIDLSTDYCRLAKWRVTDPGEYARALHVEKPPPAPAGMASLFDELDEATP